MRLAFSFALLVAFAALVGADELPAPFLKPVVPNANSVRVRIATSEEKGSFYHFAAKAPTAKGKSEVVDVTVAFEVRPGPSYVTAKKWQSWGYDVPANKIGVLPELVIRGAQLAPKSNKGHDVDVRLPGIRLQIVEPPGNTDTVLGCDLLLSMSDVTKNTDRVFEPRLYFADQLFELTVPSGAIKRPGTGEEAPTEPATSTDSTLVPVMGVTRTRGVAVFTYAAINGLPRYRTPDGKEVPVNVTVSSTTRCPGGITMSMGAARGCKIELEEKEIPATGSSFQTAIVRGTVKELRIGLQTGPGLKQPQDLVLKDVTVWVDKNDSGHMVWLGPEFLRAQLKDPVYSCGPDGAWKLFGRAKPNVLADVKTRAKKP